MKKIFILLLLCLASIFLASDGYSDNKRESIKIGVFNLFDQVSLKQVNAQVVRAILEDNKLQEIYRDLDSGIPADRIGLVHKLKQNHDSGIDTIITIRWPSFPGSRYDRIPKGKDRVQSLTLLGRFLKDFGEYINVYSLQNECLAGPGEYYEQDMKEDGNGVIPAIAWLEDLAIKAKEVIVSDPKFSHIKISSPVWQHVQAGVVAITNNSVKDELRKRFAFKIVEFSNQYCDYIDLHFLLLVSLKEIPEIIAYVKQQTTLPLITTEWSEGEGRKKWITQPLSENFKQKYPEIGRVKRIQTNEHFVRFCYRYPVPNKIWNDFVALMPHNPNFIKGSYEIFRSEGFVYCCWALGYQYGDPVFDVGTLFANLTTRGRNIPSQPIYNEFIAFTKSMQ